MAIVTLTEYLAYANIPADPTNANQINAALTAAGVEVEKLTQREYEADTTSPYDDGSFSPEDVVEVFDGNGSFRYFTKQAPIVEVTELEYWNGTSWVSVADSNMAYTVTEEDGEVHFDARYTFHRGTENWRVTYTFDPTPPDDIKFAVLMIAQYYISVGKFAGIRSQADGEQSWSYKLGIPDEALSICARYRRF